jgi:ribosomal-protein-alanine N-acetyltransferase
MTVTLEPWRRRSSPRRRIRGQRKIARNLRDGFPSPYTRTDADRYVSVCIKKGTGSSSAAPSWPTAPFAGSTGVFLRENGSAELGYWLAEPFWNRGVMTEAVKTICAEAFSRYEIGRIYAVPYADNFASRRVLEKAGFQYEAGRKLRLLGDRPACIRFRGRADRTQGRAGGYSRAGRKKEENRMKSYRKELLFHLPVRRGLVNITAEVQRCVAESGIREGLALINPMHITASVFINDDESGLHQDFETGSRSSRPKSRTASTATTAMRTTPTRTSSVRSWARDDGGRHGREVGLRNLGADLLL